ncbi:outer membrane beta-barrel protein [Gilvimarinus sp. F26214L]|uniref:outer membrane beta-barrel protein n=1 Tax=Gilvimarinus sp. DZF01 TaxID=3461371 RepID=UPI00404600C6
MKAPLILAAAGLAFFPLSGMAIEDLSDTWVEVDWVNLDIDEYGDDDFIDLDDGDGIALRGSYGFDTAPVEFIDSWFLFVNYIETESDATFVDDFGLLQPADTDVIKFDLGAGFNMPLNDMSQIVVRIAYSDIDIDDFNIGASDTTSISDLGDDSSDGFYLDGSWRAQISQNVEVSAGLRYTDIEETDQFSVIGNALFEITENWGVNVSADVGDELTTIGIGARYSF